MMRFIPLSIALVVVVLAPSCASPLPRELCGEGEGEDATFGPTLDGASAPAELGTMPLNGMLFVAARNQGEPVQATVETGGVDSTARAVDVDEDGPVVRLLFDDLVADSSYVATLRIDPNVAPNGAQTVRDVGFATSSLVDDTPPVFAGAATIETVRSVDGEECSGAGTLVNIIAPAIEDEGGVAGVKLLAAGSGQLTFALGNGNHIIDTRETGINARYQIIAVDLAGNESAPLDVEVP
jgi:hypothetical protein